MTEKHLEDLDLRELEDQGFIFGCIILFVFILASVAVLWGIGAVAWKLSGIGFGH